MAFTDHKIHAFTHKITDLADQPNLPPDELKARFDSSPEELRQAVNAICDDADALSKRVDGIVSEAFDGVIEKSMFSETLSSELDAKASQSALEAQANILQSAIDDEITARQSADSSLSSRISSVQSTAAKKCEIYIGSYEGEFYSGQTGSRYISLGFIPRAVIVFNQNGNIDDGGYSYGGVATTITANSQHLKIEGAGFRVYQDKSTVLLNQLDMTYGYLAFK